FNSTLRKGNITHHEYIQVGKGRDVGLHQITTFERKVAGGNVNGDYVVHNTIWPIDNCTVWNPCCPHVYQSKFISVSAYNISGYIPDFGFSLRAES
ncbi:callose synthase 10, partial [Tanacetum coccineum]